MLPDIGKKNFPKGETVNKKNFPAKKAPVATPITKKTSKMPSPKQAGKLGAGGGKGKGKEGSCGK